MDFIPDRRQRAPPICPPLDSGIVNGPPDDMDRRGIAMDAVMFVFVGEDHPSAPSKRIEQTCHLSHVEGGPFSARFRQETFVGTPHVDPNAQLRNRATPVPPR